MNANKYQLFLNQFNDKNIQANLKCVLVSMRPIEIEAIGSTKYIFGFKGNVLSSPFV